MSTNHRGSRQRMATRSADKTLPTDILANSATSAIVPPGSGSRRDFLQNAGVGFGSIALSHLLQRDSVAAAPPSHQMPFAKNVHLAVYGRWAESFGSGGSQAVAQ